MIEPLSVYTMKRVALERRFPKILRFRPSGLCLAEDTFEEASEMSSTAHLHL